MNTRVQRHRSTLCTSQATSNPGSFRKVEHPIKLSPKRATMNWIRPLENLVEISLVLWLLEIILEPTEPDQVSYLRKLNSI